MREFEKYWNEYIILGSPPFGFFIRFIFRKGGCPTVYAKKENTALKLLGLAKFCRCHGISDSGQICELIIRHAEAHTGKKRILIYTQSFSDFIAENRSKLEKYFLISDTEEVYEA